MLSTRIIISCRWVRKIEFALYFIRYTARRALSDAVSAAGGDATIYDRTMTTRTCDYEIAQKKRRRRVFVEPTNGCSSCSPSPCSTNKKYHEVQSSRHSTTRKNDLLVARCFCKSLSANLSLCHALSCAKTAKGIDVLFRPEILGARDTLC